MLKKSSPNLQHRSIVAGNSISTYTSFSEKFETNTSIVWRNISADIATTIMKQISRFSQKISLISFINKTFKQEITIVLVNYILQSTEKTIDFPDTFENIKKGSRIGFQFGTEAITNSSLFSNSTKFTTKFFDETSFLSEISFRISIILVYMFHFLLIKNCFI